MGGYSGLSKVEMPTVSADGLGAISGSFYTMGGESGRIGRTEQGRQDGNVSTRRF
jgi:hypothetical protein